MATSTHSGDHVFQGTVNFVGGIVSKIERSQFQQEDLAVFPIPLTSLRIHDAYQTVLTGTAGTDDLGLLGTAFGTSAPTVVTSDLKAATGTQYARFEVMLPESYQTGQTVVLRAFAGMKTTVSDGSATIDFQAYKKTGDGGITGGDIVSTAATSINGSTTNSARDFQVTASTLAPGDILDCRVAIAITDSATGTAVIGEIDYLALCCDIRG
jgi:hypothetical protein